MSEQDNQNPAPPRPTIKTSAVPLKKETVRITLRPQSPDAPDTPAPPPPSAPLPTAPAAQSAPPPPRPMAPTVPLAPPPRPGGPPPSAAGRPAPPTAPMGSKTIPLSQPPARPTTPMVGKQTTKIAGGAPNTQPLPRATVKLQPSAAPSASSPVSSVSIRTSAIEEDEEINEGPLNVMGWVALVGAIAALLGVLATWDKVDFFSEGVVKVDAGNKESRADAIKQWRNASPPEGFKLPADFSPFDKKDEKGGIVSEYDQRQPTTPERPLPP